MMQFRVLKAKALKKMVASISTISTKAFIAFSEKEVRISLSDENTDIDALLIITVEGFFDEYHSTRPLVISVDSSKLSDVLSSAEDDDQVYAVLTDESPVSILAIHVYDSSKNEKRVEKLEAPETLGDNNLVHEEMDYACEVSIRSPYLKYVVLHSKKNQQPVIITVTNTELKLASGADSVKLPIGKDDLTSKSEDEPLHHELELPLHRHAGTFSLASQLSEKVKIVFSELASGSPPPSLEFPISQSFKLCFYFPQHSYRNVVFLRVLSAKLLKEMVKSILNISNEALIEFSEKEVVISAENSKKNVNALLKIAPRFFHAYRCSRPLIIRIDPRQLASILISLKDDDRVCIFIKDKTLITSLAIHTRSSKEQRNVTVQIEAAQTVANKFDIDESLYEYEVGMSPLHFGDIVAHSECFKEPIDVFVTGISVTLTTGSHSVVLSKEKESECQLDKVTMSIQEQLQLSLHPHAEAFITACQIADIVKLRDSYATSACHPPLLLEFPIGAFCKLLFYFSFRFYA